MLYRFYPPIQHDKRPKIKTIIWALEINKEAYISIGAARYSAQFMREVHQFYAIY